MIKRSIPLLAVVAVLFAGFAYQAGLFSNDQTAQTREARSSATGRPGDGRGGFPAARVVVTEAQEKMMAPSTQVPGTVISNRDARLAAEVGGKVNWVVEVGETVDEGGVVAILDDTQAKLNVRERRAEVARLAARVKFLDDRYTRFSDLGDEIGESETSLMQMRSERDEARQQLASARVALERAAWQLDRTEIKAPYAGSVVARSVQIGEFANPGAEIVRLVDTRSLEVRAQASDRLLSAVHPGDKVTVIGRNETIDGTVRAIVPVGDETTRTLELRVGLPPQTPWYVGGAVRVTLPSAQPRLAVAAPRDTLLIRGDGISVFKVDSEGMARKISVEVGIAEGELIELVGNVLPGDQLIVRGAERLRDGQRVDVDPPKSETNRPATPPAEAA